MLPTIFYGEPETTIERITAFNGSVGWRFASLLAEKSCLLRDFGLNMGTSTDQTKISEKLLESVELFIEEYKLLTKGIQSPPSLQLTSLTCPAAKKNTGFVAVRPNVLVEPRNHQHSNPVVSLKLQTRDSLAIGQETGVRTNMKAPRWRHFLPRLYSPSMKRVWIHPYMNPWTTTSTRFIEPVNTAEQTI